jgi:DNA-3-methyladenine glycosylase II
MKLYTVKGNLTPQPPFDFQKSLGFIREFAPTRAEQQIGEQSLTKALYVQGQLCGFDLKSIGTVDAPQLEYTLYAAHPIDAALETAMLDQIAFAYSLSDDLHSFYDCGQCDEDFASVVKMLYGLHHVKFPTPFESACWAVLSQRVPMTVGHQIKQALMEQYGEQLMIADAPCRAFPGPDRLLQTTQADLEALVRNARKAEYLRAVIRAFSGVDETFLRSGDYDEVHKWLLSIKGVGEWSAELILWRGLGRTPQWRIAPDSISGQRMIDAASKVYGHGRTLSVKEFSALAEQYGEWQGYWLYYLRTAS